MLHVSSNLNVLRFRLTAERHARSVLLQRRLHHFPRSYKFKAKMSNKRIRLQLMLDFDGTISTADTTAVIGSRCIAKAHELALPDTPDDKLPQPMDLYSERYMQDYRDWKTSYHPPLEQRKMRDEEVAFLSQSKHIEQDSFLRVRNAVLNSPGSMAEMEHDEAMRNEFMIDAGRQAVRAGEVRIRDPENLKKLIAISEREGNDWAIVSVSWSRRFILGVLLEAGLIQEGHREHRIKKIRCNELLAPLFYDQDDRPAVLCSAADKQDAFIRLREEWDKEEEGDGDGDGDQGSCCDGGGLIDVYVGDSMTDIGCLAGPTVGMYLTQDGEDDAVIETLKRLDIECLSTSDLPKTNVVRSLLDKMNSLLLQNRPPYLVCKITSFQGLHEWVSLWI